MTPGHFVALIIALVCFAPSVALAVWLVARLVKR